MFLSVNSALRWASLMITIDNYQLPSMNRMYGLPPPSTMNELLRGLTQEQARMQAERMLHMASELNDPACMQYIDAKYRLNDDWEIIMHRVMSGLMYNGGINQRDIRSLVSQYLGRGTVSHRQLRKELKCMNRDVMRYRTDVYNVMDNIHRKVMNHLDERMKECGLVESTSCCVSA